MVLRTIVSAELGWVTAGSTTSSFTAAHYALDLSSGQINEVEYLDLEEKYLHKYTAYCILYDITTSRTKSIKRCAVCGPMLRPSPSIHYPLLCK